MFLSVTSTVKALRTEDGLFLVVLQTEQDFIDIAAAGLNWVRIPIGFWAIQTEEDEPFLQGVSWKCVILLSLAVGSCDRLARVRLTI